MATLAPRRAAATAWLAPLPPGTVTNDCPASVSPARGRRGARVTRSMVRLPTITTFACMTSVLFSPTPRAGSAKLVECVGRRRGGFAQHDTRGDDQLLHRAVTARRNPPQQNLGRTFAQLQDRLP